MSEATKDNTGQAVYERYIADLERDDEEIATIKARNAAECQKVLERKKKRMKQAKNEGLSPAVLSALMGFRKAQRKAAAIIEDLEEDVRDDFDAVLEALEPVADLPLFGAVKADIETQKAERDEKASAKVEAQRAKMKAMARKDDGEQQVASNVTAITDGIKPLH